MERNPEANLETGIDMVANGYLREWDMGPDTEASRTLARSKVATLVAILHQAADDWAENLVEWSAADDVAIGIGPTEGAPAEAIAKLRKLEAIVRGEDQ